MSNTLLALLLAWILFNQADGRYRAVNLIWAAVWLTVYKTVIVLLPVVIEAYK